VQLVAIRRVILGVLVLGMGGLLAELTLLAHYADFKQQIPLVLLAAGLAALIIDLAASRTWSHRVVQLTMVMFIAAGLLGMYFHYQGSREFQIEMDPTMSGMNLMWHVLQAKSPPTLSPGTMVQMGILGLGYAYLRRTQ
jgi:multisubunit Na+/H+ antiporter MnhF subunit